MSQFTGIDLSTLPAPEVVETLDVEVIIAEMKAHLIALFPEAAPVLALESELLTRSIVQFAYREVGQRARFNDGSKGNMLAHASGANLDNLAANHDVQRQVVQEADATLNPPRPRVMESDDRLRRRTQLAPEGYASAGPEGAYIAHGMSAHVDVKDIDASSPSPGVVEITVLSRLGDGTADAELPYVGAALTGEDVRPMTDQVTVQSAVIVPYEITASLTLYRGPDADVVLANAIAAITIYAETHHALGHDITISGLHAALHQAGVQKVTLTSPADDLVIPAQSAAFCTDLDVTIGGYDA